MSCLPAVARCFTSWWSSRWKDPDDLGIGEKRRMSFSVETLPQGDGAHPDAGRRAEMQQGRTQELEPPVAILEGTGTPLSHNRFESFCGELLLLLWALPSTATSGASFSRTTTSASGSCTTAQSTRRFHEHIGVLQLLPKPHQHQSGTQCRSKLAKQSIPICWRRIHPAIRRGPSLQP